MVIPVHTQHYMMLQRNLLYTAVTRGKRLVVLVGSRKALGMAVRNAEIALRCSGLAPAPARLALEPAADDGLQAVAGAAAVERQLEVGAGAHEQVRHQVEEERREDVQLRRRRCRRCRTRWPTVMPTIGQKVTGSLMARL